MKRRLLNILAVLSLAMEITAAVAWILSYACPHLWHSAAAEGTYSCFVESSDGALYVTRLSPVPFRALNASEWWLLGVRYVSTGALDDRTRTLLVPYRVVAVAGAILPAIWLWRYRRHRRLRSDGMPHCAKCDYNLTGNISGICPECGTPVPGGAVAGSDRV